MKTWRHDHNAFRSERLGFGSTRAHHATGVEALEEAEVITLVGYGPDGSKAAEQVRAEAIRRGLPTEGLPSGEAAPVGNVGSQRQFVAATWLFRDDA